MFALTLALTLAQATSPSSQGSAERICLQRVGYSLLWEDEHGWRRTWAIRAEGELPCTPVPPTERWSLYPVAEGMAFSREHFSQTVQLMRGSAICGLDIERYGGLCDNDLRALAGLGQLRHLRVATTFDLWFPDSVLTDEGFRSLGALRGLESLSLSGLWQVDDETIAWLLGRLPRLECFALSGRREMTEPLLRALREHPTIESSSFWGVGSLTNAQLQSLCDETGPVRLELHWMEGLDGELLAALPNAGVLRHLVLADRRWVDDTTAAQLARFEALQVLDLSDCPIGTEGLRHVARLPSSRSLILRTVPAEALSALPELLRSETLEALALEDCRGLGRDDYELFFDAKRLRVLRLVACRPLRHDSILRLREALPQLRVITW